jgi:H+/gluconate symporter-like permease
MEAFIWVVYLGIFVGGPIAYIGYYIWQKIKQRSESEEEKKLRLQKEAEKVQRNERAAERVNTFIAGSIAIVAVLIMLSGIGLFLYQVMGWLESGTWSEVSTWALFAYFDIDIVKEVSSWQWRGIQKIAVWILEASLAGALFISGALVLLLSIYAKDN